MKKDADETPFSSNRQREGRGIARHSQTDNTDVAFHFPRSGNSAGALEQACMEQFLLKTTSVLFLTSFVTATYVRLSNSGSCFS